MQSNRPAEGGFKQRRLRDAPSFRYESRSAGAQEAHGPLPRTQLRTRIVGIHVARNLSRCVDGVEDTAFISTLVDCLLYAYSVFVTYVFENQFGLSRMR